MRKGIFMLLFAGLAAACQVGPPIVVEPPDSSSIIRSGSSFGECFGYCVNEVVIDSSHLAFSQRSWTPEQYPSRRLLGSVTPEEWQSLLESVNMQKFVELDSVIGCPDCADGGAEWIEIEMPEMKKRVTFEYGAGIEGIEALLAKVRLIRMGFEEQVAAIYPIDDAQVLPNVLINDLPPDSLWQDYFNLKDVRIDGDTLRLVAGYSGGCQPHFFALYMSPAAFAESEPVQANFYLHHDANGDLCEAYLRHGFSFNVRPIAELYRDMYKQYGAIILNVYEHDSFGPAKKLSVQYVPE